MAWTLWVLRQKLMELHEDTYEMCEPTNEEE
jgi:hypothetical protein